jgi:hypothetical protein
MINLIAYEILRQARQRQRNAPPRQSVSKYAAGTPGVPGPKSQRQYQLREQPRKFRRYKKEQAIITAAMQEAQRQAQEGSDVELNIEIEYW